MNDSSGTPPGKVPNMRTLSSTPSAYSNVTSACVQLHLRVQQLLGTSPESVLSSMLSLSSVQSIIDLFNGMHEALEAIAEVVNSLPPVYAADLPHLHAASVVNQCHPLMMQTYKPVLTTGDGDCTPSQELYVAVSGNMCLYTYAVIMWGK